MNRMRPPTNRRTIALTRAEHELLLQLTSTAAHVEAARVGRMEGRPAGSHDRVTIREARRMTAELVALKATLAEALPPDDPEHEPPAYVEVQPDPPALYVLRRRSDGRRLGQYETREAAEAAAVDYAWFTPAADRMMSDEEEPREWPAGSLGAKLAEEVEPWST